MIIVVRPNIRKNALDLVTVFLFAWIINPMAVDFYNWKIFAVAALGWCIIAYFHSPAMFIRCALEKGMLCYLLFEIILILYVIAGHRRFYFQSMSIPFIFLISKYYLTSVKSRERFRFVYTVALLYIAVIAVNTIIELKINPNVARILAGGSTALTMRYASPIRGGYAFVYSMMLVVVNEMLQFVQADCEASKPIWKWLNIALIIVGAVLVFRSQYTTALLFMAFGIFLAVVLFSTKRIYKAIGAVMAVIIFIIIITGAMPAIIRELSTFMPEGEMKIHFIELANTANGDSSVNSLTRVNAFRHSIQYFLSNPIFGAGKAQNHNEIIDVFAENGLLGGIPYFAALIYMFRSARISIINMAQRKMFFFTELIMIGLFFFNPVSDGLFYLVMFGLVPIKYRLQTAEIKQA